MWNKIHNKYSVSVDPWITGNEGDSCDIWTIIWDGMYKADLQSLFRKQKNKSENSGMDSLLATGEFCRNMFSYINRTGHIQEYKEWIS